MKTQKLLSSLLLVAAALVIAPVSARADFNGQDSKVFKAMIHDINSFCTSSATCEGVETRLLFDATAGTADASVAPSMPRLERIAKDQSGIWADTILEGGYDADGLTSLDRIEGVFNAEGLVGYRITYSERAWTTGPGGERVNEGRISESTFVSPNLTSWFRDRQAFATFQTN